MTRLSCNFKFLDRLQKLDHVVDVEEEVIPARELHERLIVRRPVHVSIDRPVPLRIPIRIAVLIARMNETIRDRALVCSFSITYSSITAY
jgi:hypothetical protein